MFLYLKIFKPKMKIFSIFALITTSIMEHNYKYNDYIIANHRLRFEGVVGGWVARCLPSFEPFAVEADPAVECDMVAVADSILVDESCVELTRFDFAEGDAECIFLRSDDDYILTIANSTTPTHIFACNRRDTRRVRICVGESVNASFLRFGIWLMVNISMAQNSVAAVHSSVIVCHDEAVLFLGESGTGKSTHTRLWRENIEGVQLLNDDSPFIGIRDGKVIAYGSPWSGKTPCYKNESYPIRAIVRLSQAPHNKIYRLRKMQAIGALLPSLPPAFLFDAELEDAVMNILSAVVGGVPMYHLECLPDAAAAQLSHDTVFEV